MTLITSGVCNPRNLSINSKGSIHDDATATELGFRAGTVAGDIHLEQFGGILVSAFGQQWCETGSLSMYFMHATADAEPVEATLDIGESQTPLHNAQIAELQAWATRRSQQLCIHETDAPLMHPLSRCCVMRILAGHWKPSHDAHLAMIRFFVTRAE